MADAGDGFPVGIFNTGSAIVTIDGNASESINGSPTVSLAAGLGVIITCDGAEWIGLIYNLDFSGLAAIEGNALAATDGFIVDDAGVPKRMEYTDAGIRIQTITDTTDTLATADMNTFIRYNNASAIAVTLDTGTGKVGNFVIIKQDGAGQVTVSGTATLETAIGSKTRKQKSVIILFQDEADVWSVYGDTAA